MRAAQHHGRARLAYWDSKRKMLIHVGMPLVVLLLTATFGVHYWRSSHAATACTVDPNLLVNSCHAWIGAWATDYPQAAPGVRNQITYHEQRIGRNVDMIKDYKNGGQGLGPDDKYYINRANTYVVVTWRPGSDFGSAGGSNATINANIDAMANSVKSVAPHKVFLSVWHEPENDVDAGTSACRNASGNAGSPAQYRAMWQNVRNRFNNLGINNVVWTWIPMGYSGWTCMDKDLYPGNNLVDWIMWDPYGQSDKSTWDGQIGSFYNWMSANSDATHAFTSKIWGIAETSTHLSSQTASSNWWVQAKTALDTNKFPKLKAYIVFDSNAGKQDNRIMYWCNPTTASAVIDNHSTCGDDRVDLNEQNAYKAFVNDPRLTDAFYGGVDTTPPTVGVSTPANGATVSGSTTVTATASDASGIQQVSFYLDGSTTALRTITSMGPYSFAWDTTNLNNGTHTLRAQATDNSSNHNTASVSVTVTVHNTVVDNINPAVSLAAVPTTVNVGSPVTLTATTTDNIGVTRVDFFAGNTLIATKTQATGTLTWNPTQTWTPSAAGVVSLTATAYDAAGNHATSVAVSVNVNNITGGLVGDLGGNPDGTPDGHVNGIDYGILISHLNQVWAPGNLDHSSDNIISASDVAILLGHWTW